MKKIKKIIYATIWLLLSTSANSASCGGSCGGCAGIWTNIEQASIEIDNAFNQAEKDIAEKYELDIVFMLLGNKEIERKIAVLKSQLEGLERKILLIDTEMVSVLKEAKEKKVKQTTKKGSNNG